MDSKFPDLFEICKNHLADPTFAHETETEFIEWVRLKYLREMPPSHQIPNGYRSSVEQELDQQISQWLKVILYGQTLKSGRKKA